MLFDSWSALGRVALVTAVSFVVVVALLRIAGQQALAKMSSYDVVFSVTLGSVVATVAISKEISISEALTAIVVLLALQELTRFLQSRYLAMHHAVRQAPRVVLWDGDLLEDRMREFSMSADEIRAAVRLAGYRSLSEIRCVALENDGAWSVIPKTDEPSDESAFYGLPIPGRPGAPEVKMSSGRAAPTHRLP